MSEDNCGYNIESKIPATGKLRFIEVKGRISGADTVTITRHEVLTGLKKPDDFVLALVNVNGDSATLCYVVRPFQKEPDFGVVSVNYKLLDHMDRSEIPQ